MRIFDECMKLEALIARGLRNSRIVTGAGCAHR
jgi:hypothetical protein